jgi:hypothetical protein
MKMEAFKKLQSLKWHAGTLLIGFLIGTYSSSYQRPGGNPVAPDLAGGGVGKAMDASDDPEAMVLDAAKKLAIKRSNDLIRAGILRKLSGADQSLLGQDGKVAEALLNHLGVPTQRKHEIQEAVDRLWETTSRDMKSRMVLDEKESSEEEGLQVYRVAADPEAAEVALHELQLDLASKFGNNIATSLVDGLAGPEYFGNFGKHDVRVAFSSVIYDDGSEVGKVEYTSRDPVLGIPVVRATFKKDEFLYQYLGDIFDGVE